MHTQYLKSLSRSYSEFVVALGETTFFLKTVTVLKSFSGRTANTSRSYVLPDCDRNVEALLQVFIAQSNPDATKSFPHMSCLLYLLPPCP